ncbi:MAG: primary-amine oxidase [Pseudomonadota bacterium]
MSHPLAPLTAQEIGAAVELFRADARTAQDALFSSVALVEPDKAALQDWPGTTVARAARLLGRDATADGGFLADIDLDAGEVTCYERLPTDAQVPYGMGDYGVAAKLTKEDPDWQAALKRRGITELELVQVDPWPGGGFVHESIPAGHRAMRCISFIRTDKSDNGYARPIQGLIAQVDLTLGKVAHVEDSLDVPIPDAPGRYDDTPVSPVREQLRPLDIQQPEGPSFSIDGHRISWQGWDLRVTVHPVHGLVLHQLALHERPILHRASLSEMIVPYGDKDGMHTWKHVMDASEYSMGTLLNSLQLGCDCLGEIAYLDIDLITWEGKARTVKNAICIHEEDYGIQWKHSDGLSETSEVRRSRRLVVSAIHTVGNYDYGFYWYLYLDGTIQMEVKLTGIVGVSAIPDGPTPNPSQAPRIAANLVSPVHQHLFCFRLDWALDGGANSLYECNMQALPKGDDNPWGTQFAMVAEHLRSEQAAQRDVNPASTRYWKVTNPSSHNGWGEPVAYKLLPGATPTLLADADSTVGKRAVFATHNLWATAYAEGEESAAGPHTVMHNGMHGLDAYTQQDRDISECDLVMWHTFGLNHTPRPEDWPVMPVEYCGFHLIPVGFFDRNPTLDLPTSKCHSD